MSGRWAFVSLLFVVSSIDHAAIGLASTLIHQRQSEKKGRKNFCKEHKTFSYGIPFFSAYRRCKFKARQTAISYARMSEINNEEGRSKNKCPMTFLKIKFFRHPQIATLKWICKDKKNKTKHGGDFKWNLSQITQ